LVLKSFLHLAINSCFVIIAKQPMFLSNQKPIPFSSCQDMSMNPVKFLANQMQNYRYQVPVSELVTPLFYIYTAHEVQFSADRCTLLMS